MERVPPVSISHPNHFVRVAQRVAENENNSSDCGALFANQFENTANYRAHLKTGRRLILQVAIVRHLKLHSRTRILHRIGNMESDQREDQCFCQRSRHRWNCRWSVEHPEDKRS